MLIKKELKPLSLQFKCLFHLRLKGRKENKRPTLELMQIHKIKRLSEPKLRKTFHPVI